MSRVLMNLLLNARDAMPLGGVIAMRTANMQLRVDSWHGLPQGRYVMLEISDTGTGMDPETLRHIFQPFFSTKGSRGTGLGLSTVQRIIADAGGEIWARSQPDHGTTFTICLPRAEDNPAASDNDSGPRPTTLGQGTILLAEDEESVRKLLRHILDASGYRVIEAADGVEAWRLFEQNAGEIDLLLTDIIMPGMHGRELFQRAQAAKPGLKVIYMSGYTDDVLFNMGPIGPDVSFLAKPLKLDLLSSMIREVLDSSR
jgi:CheY-like chemotaxis protein